MLAAKHHAAKVDRHRPVPDLHLELVDGEIHTDPRIAEGGGIVVQDVKLSEGIDGLGNQVLNGRLLGDVRSDRDGATACSVDLPGNSLCAGFVDVGDRDAGALGRQPKCTGTADAGGGTRDDGRSSKKSIRMGRQRGHIMLQHAPSIAMPRACWIHRAAKHCLVMLRRRVVVIAARHCVARCDRARGAQRCARRGRVTRCRRPREVRSTAGTAAAPVASGRVYGLRVLCFALPFDLLFEFLFAPVAPRFFAGAAWRLF